MKIPKITIAFFIVCLCAFALVYYQRTVILEVENTSDVKIFYIVDISNFANKSDFGGYWGGELRPGKSKRFICKGVLTGQIQFQYKYIRSHEDEFYTKFRVLEWDIKSTGNRHWEVIIDEEGVLISRGTLPNL